MRPKAVLVTGAPGSGKTTLAAQLARLLRVPFIARDDIRGGLFFTAGAWGDELVRVPSADEAVDVFLQTVEALLARGVSCVVEYVIRSHRPADLDRLLAAGECVVIMTRCDAASSRVVERNRSDRFVANRAFLDAMGFGSVAEHTEAVVPTGTSRTWARSSRSLPRSTRRDLDGVGRCQDVRVRLHLRLADEADERAMQELDGLARGGDAERIALIHQAVAGRRCLVEVDDRIVGYVMTAPRGFFARDFVELLMVDDVVRRRGVGRALLGAAVDSAGTTRVFSSTNESNSAMRSLFASAGWTLSGRLDGLDDGDPELVYFVDQVVGVDIEIRELARDELARVGEIDRTERISMLFEQQGTELVERPGTWDSPPWDPDGHGEHSVAAQRSALEHYADAGGIGRGAFSNGLLVGIGVVVPHLRPGIAQLAFLHVSRRFRSAGLGGRLAADLETIASDAGDTEIVVTATPSENTVRFYLGRGYLPMASPLPELFELEPEDIHLSKPI